MICITEVNTYKHIFVTETPQRDRLVAQWIIVDDRLVCQWIIAKD